MSKKRSGGFTLIELLVVIAIMMLLTSVVSASLRSVRIKARDTKRVADLAQIKNSLNLYAIDNGDFPTAYEWVTSDLGCQWIFGLEEYFSCVPKDPLNTKSGQGPQYGPDNYVYAYFYVPGMGDDYDLIALFEDPENPNRCELKLWKAHNSMTPGTPWCPTWSNLLYADH